MSLLPEDRRDHGGSEREENYDKLLGRIESLTSPGKESVVVS